MDQLDSLTARSSHGPLAYRVVEYSSYSAGYRPEMIMEDKPTEQASRWSSAANDQYQFLILKLARPALICTHHAPYQLMYVICDAVSSDDNFWQVS